MKKRWIAGGLILLLLAGSGCQTRKDEKEYSDALEAQRGQQDPLLPDVWQPEYPLNQKKPEELPAEAIVWGPGRELDESGRPTACVKLQEEYGKYRAFFLASEDHRICLTFDEGYENGYTGQILDVLREKGVSAVFFVTMDYVKREPELVRRMIREGHQVGNHTTHHPNMTQISLEKAEQEVQELHDYVKQEFGYTMRLFRAPEGAISERTMALLQQMGYANVLWSFAYKDWDPQRQPEPAAALEKMIAACHPGALYLLHAVSKTNAEVLGLFIDGVQKQGYEFRLL